MKTQFYFITVILLLSFVVSCTKDSADFTGGPSQDNINQFENFKKGVQLLPTDEFLKLPRINLESLKPVEGFELHPRTSKLTLNTPPPRSQGEEGSCAAFASGYCALSYWKYIKTIPKPSTYTNDFLCSPEHLYNNSKINPFSSDCKEGSFMPNVLNFIKDVGVCTWSLMPYSDQNGCNVHYPSGYTPYTKTTTSKTKVFNPKTGTFYYPISYLTIYPPFEKYKVSTWGTIHTFPLVGVICKNIKDVLLTGRPIIACFNVDANFYIQTKYPPYYYHTPGGKIDGGHAVVVIGYDDNKQLFKVQNSWGQNFGDGGYFYIPYSNVGVFKELYTFN